MGMTQLDLALSSGIGYSTYTRLERVGVVTKPIIRKLAVFHKITIKKMIAALAVTRAEFMTKERARRRRAKAQK